MVLDLLIFLFWIVWVLVSTIAVHEIGHGLMLKKYGFKPKLKFNFKDIYFDLPSQLTKDQTIKVLLAGIVAGWINLFIWFAILPTQWGWLVILINVVIYWFGSQHDVKLMVFLQKQKV